MAIAVASQKGGVGKTSSTISLAAGLARKGKRVLLVDIDSQANSSKVLLPNYPQIQKHQTVFATILERSQLPTHQTSVPNLEIVPSHILLFNTVVEFTTAIDHREERLKKELDAVKDNYGYVFIDCPLLSPGSPSMPSRPLTRLSLLFHPGTSSLIRLSRSVRPSKRFVSTSTPTLSCLTSSSR
ncbi:ParA family protein [Streptomyces lydicus]|uniref:ParA family protein n=1 Tax=Streptomyces lydicus TaxID=47763 RepID=UPI0036E99157